MQVEDQDGGPPLIACDISAAGLRVYSPRLRWPGQLVRVRFHLPNLARAMRVTCRVTDLFQAPPQSGYGLSLQFLALAPKAQLAVLRYIAARLRAENEGLTNEALALEGLPVANDDRNGREQPSL